MTKYATLKKYQPYIDVIMKDLGIPKDKVDIEWIFKPYRSMGGDAILWGNTNSKVRLGRVRVDSHSDHKYIIKTLMHELKHIQQFFSGRLTGGISKPIETKRGIKYVFGREWDGKWVANARFSRSNNKKDAAYHALPWEIEAYAYMEENNRLFPNNKLPTSKKHVGTVGKVKFYKLDGKDK